MTTYLVFEERPVEPGRKTGVWYVRATRDLSVLGVIAWFGRWRQYTFSPGFETTFNPECLRAIADKCAELTAEHRSRSRS